MLFTLGGTTPRIQTAELMQTSYNRVLIIHNVFYQNSCEPTVLSLLTSLYPWGIVPEISAKGITHPAGQYLLEKNKKSSQDMHAAVTLTMLYNSHCFLFTIRYVIVHLSLCEDIS